MANMKVLFVCTANQIRSPTAAEIFSTWPDVETRSAGLDRAAKVVLSAEQIQWADIIFVMERSHRNKLSKKFRGMLAGKRVVCLGIPDDYEFMQPQLVLVLLARVGPYLRRS